MLQQEEREMIVASFVSDREEQIVQMKTFEPQGLRNKNKT